MSRDPLVATFIAPLLLAVRVVGWRSWRWVVIAIVTIVLAARLPHNVAQELLPGTYCTALLTLGGLTFGWRLFAHFSHLADDTLRYRRLAVVVQVILLVVCLGLLLPVPA